MIKSRNPPKPVLLLPLARNKLTLTVALKLEFIGVRTTVVRSKVKPLPYNLHLAVNFQECALLFNLESTGRFNC